MSLLDKFNSIEVKQTLVFRSMIVNFAWLITRLMSKVVQH